MAPAGAIDPLSGEHYAALRRPCYVALASLLSSLGPRIDGDVLVTEDGRSLTAGDIHVVLGVAVVASVPTNPAVGRTIDAGLLTSRLHRLPQLRPSRTLALPLTVAGTAPLSKTQTCHCRKSATAEGVPWSLVGLQLLVVAPPANP